MVQVNDYAYDEIKADKPKAWLVTIDGKDIWLPKSQCTINKEGCIITIPDWLAANNGLM